MKQIAQNIAKSIIAFAFLSSLSQADEVQERIDRLKAENELLELQKRNAELKELDALQKENELLELKRKNAALKRGESLSQSSANSTNAIASTQSSKCAKGELGKYAPTGCLIGVEVGAAFGVYNAIWGAGYIGIPQTSSGVSLPISFTFGYQWYFLRDMGIRIRANLGYGAHFANMSHSINAINHSIHYGVEVSYMYDFISTSKRTFGADVGYGFEGMSLFGSSAKDKYDGTAYNAGMSKFNFYQFRLGVHYYHNIKHQLWLSYIYKPYTSKWVEKAHDTAPNNFITLGYGYRF